MNKDTNDKQGLQDFSNFPIRRDLLAEILDTEEAVNILQELGEDPETPVEVLRKLAKIPNGFVRYSVALNHSSTADILELLSTDEEPDVIAGVASNPNTPPEVLRKISETSDCSWIVALNPSAPEDLLMEFAFSDDFHVKINLARNPNLPDSARNVLAESIDATIEKLNPDGSEFISEIIKSLLTGED